MKYLLKSILLVTVLAFVSCGGKDEKKPPIKIRSGKKEVVKKEANPSGADMKDMDDKGIGPVKNVELGADIDKSMAQTGEELFKKNCTACHRPDQKLIGPAPKGVLDRRSPEWVMNMILNPQVMVKEDPIAKQLLEKYGSPMLDQGLKQKEARDILEYFRTL